MVLVSNLIKRKIVMFTMIIDNTTNATKLVADVSKMANTPEKIKKISGKPYSVVTFNNVTGDYIIMNCYYSQSSNSVELTIKSGDVYHRVVGKATGYGYHRLSAALAEAIDLLNITIIDDKGQKEYIDGRGDTAMRDVLLAIAKSLNWGESVIMNEIYL